MTTIVMRALTDESTSMHASGCRPYPAENLSQSSERASSLSQDGIHVLDQNLIFSDGNGLWTPPTTGSLFPTVYLDPLVPNGSQLPLPGGTATSVTLFSPSRSRITCPFCGTLASLSSTNSLTSYCCSLPSFPRMVTTMVGGFTIVPSS